MNLRPLCLALLTCLIAPSNAHPGDPAITAQVWLPSPEDHAPSAQRLAPLLNRYQTDLYSLLHVHDIEWGPARAAALEAFYLAWQERLQAMDFDQLALEDRIDWTLWRDELRNQRRLLAFQQKRLQEVNALLPNLDALLQLAEARRALQQADGQRSGEILDATRAAIEDVRQSLKQPTPEISTTTPAQAQRAVRILNTTLASMREWHAHQDGFDPAFSYWTRKPFEAYVDATEALIKDIQRTLAHTEDPEVIVGDPIAQVKSPAGVTQSLRDAGADAIVVPAHVAPDDLPDFFAMSSRTVPEPKQLTYSALPSSSPRHGLTTCVA